MDVVPGYFQRIIEEKIEPKEILNCLIPCLLVVFAWQLEIFKTTLDMLKRVSNIVELWVIKFVSLNIFFHVVVKSYES